MPWSWHVSERAFKWLTTSCTMSHPQRHYFYLYTAVYSLNFIHIHEHTCIYLQNMVLFTQTVWVYWSSLWLHLYIQTKSLKILSHAPELLISSLQTWQVFTVYLRKCPKGVITNKFVSHNWYIVILLFEHYCKTSSWVCGFTKFVIFAAKLCNNSHDNFEFYNKWKFLARNRLSQTAHINFWYTYDSTMTVKNLLYLCVFLYLHISILAAVKFKPETVFTSHRKLVYWVSTGFLHFMYHTLYYCIS